MNDLYKPHTFEEICRVASPDVAARLDPDERYGMWWSGRRAFERKRVFQNGSEGRRYKYRYRVKERAPEDRIDVPVPDSGIHREWVDAARTASRTTAGPPTQGAANGRCRAGSCAAQSADER